jgi:anti-sigma regulatory factor (Ser/Thr protein kinase)
MKTTRAFAPDASSVPAARQFVLAAIGSVTDEQRDAVSVMVSELAMNAVEHAGTRFQVTAEITDGSLQVEVTDSGVGTATAQPRPNPTSLRGRGLFIVDRLSDAWGTSSSSAGSAKSIWFTITLDAAADSAARQPAGTEAAPSADRPASTPAGQVLRQAPAQAGHLHRLPQQHRTRLGHRPRPSADTITRLRSLHREASSAWRVRAFRTAFALPSLLK